MNRRRFMQLSAGTAALAGQPPLLQSMENQLPGTKSLPPIPGLDDLASVSMTHPFRDLFNLPIAMNDWGYAQAAKSVSAISAIAFPPYGCCGIPKIPWSPGLLLTCEMFLNDQMLSVCELPENSIVYTWYPHRVVREQIAFGIRVRTSMFLPGKLRAVVESIELTNVSGQRQRTTAGFDMRAAVTKKPDAWFTEIPGEGDNSMSWDAAHGRLTFTAQHSAAASAQGISPRAHRIVAGRMLEYDLELAPGEKKELHFVCTVAEDSTAAGRLYDKVQSQFGSVAEQNEEDFERLIRSAFIVGNSSFSGHLPELHTENETLWNLYHNGFKNLLTARRRSPDSAYGPTLLTLSGHVLPTLSFPWDTSLSSLSLALLDPEPMRKLVEVWFVQPMHKHLATDYISGQGVGPWYAVNDMAMVRCARDYLRVTGDTAWLDKKIGDQTVLDHLRYHALYWRELRKPGRELADYGSIQNLLEVVSTYVHEVAGMNAGNVSSMRFVAELLEHRGDSAGARQLRAQARQLASDINRLLYVDGKGWWRCRQPDGSYNEVRHCYDFLAVLDNMGEDLSEKQKQEMARFFWEQLASKKWMRALSSGDPDASWNIRPDHSCLGAYTAWPPMCAKGLFKIDPPEKIAPWLREIAKAGNQGPVGQAHFVEDVWPPWKGGAYKAPNDPPYIEDWCAISGGAFTDMVMDSIFGVEPSLFNGIQAKPRLDAFDRGAQLEGLRYQGAEYRVTRAGASKIAT